MQKKDNWNTSVFEDSIIIQQLKPLTDFFTEYDDWPTIAEYLNLFKLHKLSIKPVPQSETISCFEEQYEPRVYLKQELQTRTHNWHDFFNALIWLKFPETKKTLNKLHFEQANNRQHGSNRSTLENRITQFDECGAIIVSNDDKLLNLIRNHQWQELFIDRQDQFKENIRCVIFGHAIFEKALNPYIGITCHCVLLNDINLLEEVKSANNLALDHKLAQIWDSKISQAPEKFDALPLLGIPGYWPDQGKEFYLNKNYFR